jgi:hypothetical protein
MSHSFGPKVIHNVMLHIKDDTAQEDIDRFFNAMIELKVQGLIPGIVSFSYGEYNSTEGLNKNFNYGFSMIFESIEARDNYLPHPEHDKVKELILPLLYDGLNSVIAFDYILHGQNEI